MALARYGTERPEQVLGGHDGEKSKADERRRLEATSGEVWVGW